MKPEKPLTHAEQAEINRKKLDEINGTAVWHGRCHKCGSKVEGTLEQLRAHACASS